MQCSSTSPNAHLNLIRIPHSLRHLYASTALAEGIPITEVSRWLGHFSGDPILCGGVASRAC